MPILEKTEAEERIAAPEPKERVYLTGGDRVLPYENNLVRVVFADGEEIAALEPRRLFPNSLPSSYVTLLDAEGEEIAVIRSLDDLDRDSRKTVEASLADYYLVPHITKILAVNEKYGILRWTVETDRGVKSFDIRNRNHDIRVLPDGRVRVRDSDDNRYVIDDFNALDAASRLKMIADL